ncbi:hypothetical protein BDV96DRAFT_679156, partial [Lophiotrema nucula]
MLPHKDPPERIAIIGIACRLPGANNPDELWKLLAEGKTACSEIPASRYNWRAFHHPNPDTDAAHNQRGGGYIDRDLAALDAAFFNIPVQEANALDPQQRIQLETAYEALENAGIPFDSVRGSKTSVHIATVSRDYDRNSYRDPQDLAKYHLTGCGEAITSGRISYNLDLRGPCMSLDTGCSGSLVGLHLACQGLRSRETDMALVGGTNLLLGPDMTMAMSKLHMLNNDGRCYSFDSRGNGYARSEGVATIVLKRLSDAITAGDPVRAVIRATGVGQDGKTNGIMLPNSQAQEDLMRSLYLDTGLDPSETAYVEAHGTGTVAGDTTEIQSIHNVFCDGVQRTRPLIIGSIKANIGHTESASGLAGLIKAALAIERGLIPPVPDVQDLKKDLDLEQRKMRIPHQLEQWPSPGVRQALINSFGYGGTNAAAIIENYKVAEVVESNGASKSNGVGLRQKVADADVPRLFAVSAKSAKSLNGNIENLKSWLENNQESADLLGQLAFTLNTRRTHLPVRSALMARSRTDLLAAIEDALRKQPERTRTSHHLTFIFTGQGAQWWAMGRELMYTQPVFAASIQASEEILTGLGAPWSLRKELNRDAGTSRIDYSAISQPATTAIQVALVNLLESCSIKPDSVIGHSSGEIAAAYAAGALSHASALRVSYCRGKVLELMRNTSLPRGGMLVATLSESDAKGYIKEVAEGRISVACINSPSSTTISGNVDAIDALEAKLGSKSITCKKLKVDVAYHSHHMEVVEDQYLKVLDGLEVAEIRDNVRFVSSVTGVQKKTSFGIEYWVQNLVSPVRFSEALLTMRSLTQPEIEQSRAKQIFLEIGPHNTLSGPVRQTLATSGIEDTYLPALNRGKDARITFATLVGKLFELGLTVDVAAVNATLHTEHQAKEVIRNLPPYAWDYSNRYWYESRLSKEYRFRKHPYHDLLGLRLIGSTPLEPLWRNILSVDAQPWLQEHIIDGCAILPGSSFLCMAIEAVRQLNEDVGGPVICRFHLKNVTYHKPIRMPDSPNKIELVMSILSSSHRATADRLSEWHTFRITSTSDTMSWNDNCDGFIRLEYEDVTNTHLNNATDIGNRLTTMELNCTQPIDHQLLYEEMRNNGIDYGPNFSSIKSLRIGECQALGKITVPDVAQSMPSRFVQPHIIHPAMFDALMHIVLPLYTRHCSSGPVMLVSIDEVSIAANIVTDPGSQLTVCCALSPLGPLSGTAEVTAFQSVGAVLPPAVVLRGEKFRGIGTAKSSTPKTFRRQKFHELHRPLKLTLTTPGVLSSLCFTEYEAAESQLNPDEVEIQAFAFAVDDVNVDTILGSDLTSSVIGDSAGIITAVG